MKYFSDKGTPALRFDNLLEFADDFWPEEDAYARIGLAGGVISRRIVDAATGSIIEKK